MIGPARPRARDYVRVNFTVKLLLSQNFCNRPLMRFISFASNIGPAAAVPAGPAPSPLMTPLVSIVRLKKSLLPWMTRLSWVTTNSNGAAYTHVQDNITLDNYEEVITNVSGAVRGAITNEQEQTTTNLAMVTAAIARSASLISEMMTVIPNTVSLLLVCSVILISEGV